MASIVPTKSQPLHNFSLPYLTWNNSHRTSRNKLPGDTSSSSLPPPVQPELLHKTTFSSKSKKSIDGSNDNKTHVRLPNNSNMVNENNVMVKLPVSGDEESVPKIWNLRPRRSQLIESLSQTLDIKESSIMNINKRSNVMATKKKQKFSIALSRDEIEEDLFSLTGLKPSRRPKKRSKSIQKQLDIVFPGLWLGSITADSYKVSEPRLKG